MTPHRLFEESAGYDEVLIVYTVTGFEMMRFTHQNGERITVKFGDRAAVHEVFDSRAQKTKKRRMILSEPFLNVRHLQELAERFRFAASLEHA